MLQVGKNAWLLQRRQKFVRVIVASTLSLALVQVGAAAQQGESKKPNLDPVAATSPAARSAMGESPSRQAVSAQSLPKPETAKGGPKKDVPAKAVSDTPAAAPEKSTPPAFPLISTDALSTVPGIQVANAKYFPSAIDIHGSTAGVLMHARPDTKYDLLTSLSVWLEDGPLLVSVRHPSEMVLVATKFGDVCVTAGGDALVDRSSDDDTVRIVNLCTNGDTVYLNMHDKLWTASPWAHGVKAPPLEEPKSKKKREKEKGARTKTYDDIESGAIALAPGYELMIAGHALTAEEVKREDSVGRRDFKTFDGGKFVISEISIDNLTQLHDLIKGLTTHGEKASAIFNDIMKSAGMMKSKQGESGFEKHAPAPKLPPPKRKPPAKVPPPPAKTSSPASSKPAVPPPSSKPAVPPPASKPAVPPPAQSNNKSNSSSSSSSSSSKPAVPPPAKQ